jgi:hypothetical protein
MAEGRERFDQFKVGGEDPDTEATTDQPGPGGHGEDADMDQFAGDEVDDSWLYTEGGDEE